MICNAMTLGGMTCGHPFPPGGMCDNYVEHDDGSFETMDDQIERLTARIEELTEQRDYAREQRDMLNESLASWSATKPNNYALTDGK